MGTDSLTFDLSNNETSGENDKEPVSSLAAFVAALDTIMSKEGIEQKTELSGENIQGIMQLLTFNDHINRNFGFRIKELDILIAEKLLKTVSYNRKGKQELIELFRAMQLEITGEDKNNPQTPIMISRR